jgi:subtilisin family serine protease
VWLTALAPAVSAAEPTVRLLVKREPAAVTAAGVGLPLAVTADEVGLGWTAVEVPAGQEAEALAQLQADPTILEATPDYPLELTFDPNDPNYADGKQWGLIQIGADLAWEFGKGDGVTVAVVDSGVSPNHPDLADRLIPGYNFIDDNADTSDGCGHGTHVAGIVAAAGENAVGGVGVAYRAKIMPVKVMAADCSGTYSRLMEGILYAVEQGADVIVITSGGGFDHSGLHEAVQTARERGVLVVVAAGNRGNDQPFYPGSYTEAFTVAGTSQGDVAYDKSTFGAQIDVSAPATRIYSTYVTETGEPAYTYMTGTSMAAPHVAGLAALALSLDPELTLADLEATLTQTADDLGEPGKDVHFGHGRINAWRAVWAVSPAAGNLRPGHARIPALGELKAKQVAAKAAGGGIALQWQLAAAKPNATIVVYRSQIPQFDSAADVAEVAAIADDGGLSGSYLDTAVTPGATYHYWLVFADRSVETATSAMLTAVAETPRPTASKSLLLPLVQVAGS